MKAKIFSMVIFILFSVLSFANDVSTMVAVSADGNNASYALVNIQRIEVNTTETSASMTVLLKDGNVEGTYQKLLLAKDITSIDEIGKVAVYVFPNPVSNILNIQGVDEKASLSVYSLSGQCVLQDKGTEIDVTSLNQGTYILRINNQYVKFIKK